MPRNSRVAIDTLLSPRSIAMLCLGGEGIALLMALTAPFGQAQVVYFGIASLFILWVLAGTMTVVRLARNGLAQLHPFRQSYVILAILCLTTWLVSVTAIWLLPDFSQEHWARLAFRHMLIALVFGLFALLGFQSHWRTRELALKAKQAELDRLQARVNPHFLFNTLNTATALMHTRPQAAEGVLLDLSDLFRAALSDKNANSLADEIELARRYLDIEKLRLQDRLTVRWQIPDPIPATWVPTLCLQTLVENAVRHGIEHLRDGGELDICIREEGATLTLQVTNPLAPVDASRQSGHRIGIAATRARIESMTNGLGSMEAGLRGNLYIAEITLPLEASKPA